MELETEKKLIKTNALLSYVFLISGAIFGILQLITRTPGMPKLLSPSQYYLSITTHGILLAIAWLTFFIYALVYFATIDSFKRPLHSAKLAWASFFLTFIGAALAAIMLLTGNASVAWTFYAPLYAHPVFHIGLVLFVIGTWLFTAEILLTVRAWLKENPNKKLPLAMHGVTATLIMWIIATIPIAVEELFIRLPWVLNPGSGINVLLSRTLFWWFGHPVVYFWIMPAVIVWYVYLPRIMGTKLFSDYWARVVFILFIIFSIPVGVHHQYVDPGIPMSFKYIFAVFTFFVGIPSLLTAFNVAATMERAARERGAQGLLLGWIRKLPWERADFTTIALAMLLFAYGGITGFINAGYQLNLIVHNTMWIVGHFHTTAGSGATLTFIGISYLMIPLIFRKKLYSEKLAKLQAWLWFIGILIFSTFAAIAGILGSPRRTYDVTYLGSPQAAKWAPYLKLSAIGGALMFISILLFIAVILLTITKGENFEPEEEEKEIELGEPTLVDNFKLFAAVAFALAFAVYIPTIINLLKLGAPKVAGALPKGGVLG